MSTAGNPVTASELARAVAAQAVLGLLLDAEESFAEGSEAPEAHAERVV